jgi:hypothetical protein
MMRQARLLLPMLLFLVSLPAVTVRLYASDEIEYFAYLRSLWFDRDLSFDNEYRYFFDRGIARAHFFKETFLDAETETGLRRNFAPIGSAVLWSPFYALADAGVRVARAFGSEVPADGFSYPYIAAIAYGSSVYGFLAVLLSWWAARRVVGDDVTAAIAVWLGTPLLFYMYVAPGFSHACSAFAVAAFTALWLHVRRTWSLPGVVALGACAGLMGIVREQDALVAIGPAVDYLVTEMRARRDARRVVATALAGAGAFALGFMPQAISYLVLYGRMAPSPDVQQKMTWTAPNALRVLLSPANGWFFWTPLAVLALAGLVAVAVASSGPRGDERSPGAAADRRWIGLICLIMVATQVYIAGSLDTWAGAGSFGQRRLVGLTIFLVIGLAMLFRMARGRARYVVALCVLLCVWWNAGLIAQFGAGMMDRSRLTVAANAYNSFVRLPRELPQLAYRYLFDRQSFYQPRNSPPH